MTLIRNDQRQASGDEPVDGQSAENERQAQRIVEEFEERLRTGRLPFETGRSLLYQTVHVDPPAPRSINPSVPPDLETICLKALAKDAAARFQTASAFRDELRRWLDDEPLTIRAPTLLERSLRVARRHPVASLTTVFVTLVVVAFSGVAWTQHERANQARVREILEAESRDEVEAWALLDRARECMRIPIKGRRLDAQAILRRIAAPRKRLEGRRDTERLDLEIRSAFAATLVMPDVRVLKEANDLPVSPFFD